MSLKDILKIVSVDVYILVKLSGRGCVLSGFSVDLAENREFENHKVFMLDTWSDGSLIVWIEK